MSRNRSFLRGTVLALTLCGISLTPLPALANGEPIVITPASIGSIEPAVLNDVDAVTRPKFQRGKLVDFATTIEAGSVLVDTKARALFLMLGNGRAGRYSVAVGKEGFSWSGIERVSAKQKWPDWRPPEAMRKRRPELPAFMKGGPENPLGARAIYLGSSMYRIHGTNEPKSIGRAASSGCIRMNNDDVTELFQHIELGALVVVM